MDTQTEPNLRGRRVRFWWNGRLVEGHVVTRTRGTRWQISAVGLPVTCQRWDGSRRVVLERERFQVMD
jgi:hypothetical protein